LRPPGFRAAILRPGRHGAGLSACGGAPSAKLRGNMIAPETFSHIENIKKRAGYLWRFL